ncbi:MAG: hypothetical protein WCP03_04130 [Candidatus Saccharibacteria bacterium]
MKYDFSALSSVVTDSDVLALKQIYKPKSQSPWLKSIKIVAVIIASAAGASVVFGAFFYMISSLIRGDRSILTGLILLFVMILSIIFGIIYGIKFQRKDWERNVKLYRFSKANNLSFELSLSHPGYEGMIFNIGELRQAENILKNVAKKPMFEIANYTYTITRSSGSGKDSHSDTTYYRYGYIMIQLNKKLPHIVLDSKANNSSLFGANLSNLPESFDRDQVLSLEGDFDKYFTLYAPKEYEQDALYVFSPDLMAMFVDQSSEFDAEIIDDKLFIYSSKHFDFSNIALVKQLFNIIDKVGSLVVHNTDRYEDEMAAGLPENTVAETGRKLKASYVGIYVALAFMIIMFSVFFFISSR